MPKEEKNVEPKQDKNTEESVESPKDDPKDEPQLVVKEDVTTLAPAAAATDKKKFDFKAFLNTKKGKVVAGLVALVLVVAVVFAVPASRYAVAGLVIKKDVTVELIDIETGKPVSAADVTLAGQTFKTDANGKTTFKSVAVGDYKVSSKKTYYQDGSANTNVPILRNPDVVKISVTATGRQVPVSVTNKVTGKAIAGVEIFAGDSTATTTENGEATIVLPADKQTVNATFKVANYNDLTADITVTEQIDDKNKFTMTQNGKVYFLSKRTGKVDVMSSNLDGTAQNVVLAGTGKEDQETQLYTSSDWKYIALRARRDNDVKLYLISTSDNKLSVIDEGASFNLVGWSGSTLVYDVYRPNVKQWEPKQRSIKTFNADTKKISTVDNTDGLGYNAGSWSNQLYAGNIYIINGRLVFVKKWENQLWPLDSVTKKDEVISVKLDGSDRKILREFSAYATEYMVTRTNTPSSFYLRVSFQPYQPAPVEYFEYVDDKLNSTTAVDDNSFYNDSIFYKMSPSGKQSLWIEYRDKAVMFIGDANGANGKQITVEGEFRPVGWYNDEYVLLTKDGALFLYPAQPQEGIKPHKITEFMASGYMSTY